MCFFALILLQAQDIQPTPNSKYVRCRGRWKGMLEADLMPTKNEAGSNGSEEEIFNRGMEIPDKKAKKYLLVEI